MKLIVFGDSFAADQSGWPSMIGIDTINLAKKGIGEYKIFKKVMEEKSNIRKIICHTSPWRIHTRVHPVHKFNSERRENDFMLKDVEYHSKHNNEMAMVQEYIKKYYDPVFQLDIYNLLVEKLLLLADCLHITFHEPEDTAQIKNNFNTIWKKNTGDINHMSLEGNQKVAEQVMKLL